jgi:hypothetical protein
MAHLRSSRADLLDGNASALPCQCKRIVRFYERHHQRQANRLIGVSPMIEPKARKVAEKLAIETFGDSSEVPVSGDQEHGPAV